MIDQHNKLETNQPKIIALIPAYNENRRIAEVVQSASWFLPVLVVDDGSADNTAELAAEAGAQVLRLSSNQGKGEALRSGFRFALDAGYAAVLSLDADGQHNPAEIAQFIKCYSETRADLIIGARNFDEMPFLRWLGNISGRMLLSLAVGKPIRDNQSGYRLHSRRMVEKSLNSTIRGFEFEVEMIVLCLENKFTLEWVPIETIYEGEDSHIQPLKHALRFIGLSLAILKRRLF